MQKDIGDAGLISGLRRSLKEEMATLSSILAWEILWTKEPCGLQSMGEQKCQTWLSTHTHTQHIFIYMKNDITPYTCIWLYNQLLLDFCSNFSPRLILLLFTIYILMSVTQVTADVLEILRVCACFQSLSHVQLFATLWTVAPPSSSAHEVF